MATSKKSSTSKTARVMNLLSKSRDEAAEAAAELTHAEETVSTPVEIPAAAPAPAPASASHAPTPALISSMQADSAISDQVMNALETAFESEVGEQPAPAAPEAAAPEAVETEAVSPAAEPVPAPVEEPEVTAPAAPVEEPKAAAPAIEHALPPIDIKEDKSMLTIPPTQFHVDAATIYVNVMETLVEDKANKYIDLFGLCKCPRCVADVKALALNRLEPKYVVMKKGDVIPRITLYESQFSAAVTSHLLTACKMVMEHPRHDR